MSYTYDENTVSDLHKDAYGRRPCQNWWADWQSMNPVAKQMEWDSLIKAMEASIVRDKEDEAFAVTKFEALVTKTITSGAKTRGVALRWIMDASICNGDWEFLCFEHGLPYSYFRKAA